MKVPDIIYLQTCGECQNYHLCPKECKECQLDDNNVTWCRDRIYATDHPYYSEEAVTDAVIDMLNHGNIDNYDEAIAYLLKRLNPPTP